MENVRQYCLVAAVIVGITLPITVAEAIETTQVKFNNYELPFGGGQIELSAWLTKPDGDGPFPSLVLLHHCGGLTDNIRVSWAGFLAELRFVTLAPDSMRGRRNCADPAKRGIPANSAANSTANRGLMRSDAYGALTYLAERSFVDKANVGVMGFSWGAHTITSMMSRNIRLPDGLNFKAAVGLYGPCTDATRFVVVRMPWLIIIGDKDPLTLQTCDAVKERDGVIFVALSGAYHSFDDPRITSVRNDPFGNPMLYSAAATAEARELVREFLAEHFGG